MSETHSPTSGRALSESDSKELLAGFGLPTSIEREVADPAAAAAAADEIGYPVVVKLCGDAILHKTELDGVRLNLGSAEAVTAAGTELLEKGPEGAALLVAEQVQGNRELIAGVTRDPQFGPTLMFGIGGIFTEVLADVVFRLLPAEDADLATMISDLDYATMLGEFRGEPAVDTAAMIDCLRALADCVAADPSVHSIDINPLIVRDGKPVAVDALVVYE